MTRARPTPPPRICAHCGAAWTPDSPTAAQGGWDSHIAFTGAHGPHGGLFANILESCSAACRRELGVVERYPVKS